METSFLLWIYTGSQIIFVVSCIIAISLVCCLSEHTTNAIAKLPYHAERFLCHVSLLVFTAFQIAENSLTMLTKSNVTSQIRILYYAEIPQFIGVAMLMILVYKIEQYGKFKVFFLHVAYAIFGFLITVCLLTDFMSHLPKITDARDFLRISIALMFGALIVIDCMGALRTKCFRSMPDGENDVDVAATGMKYDYVHFLSKLTFWWVGSLVKKGKTKPLEKEDLLNLPKGLLTAEEAVSLNDRWKTGPKHQSLVRLIILGHVKTIIKTCVLAIFKGSADVAMPICIYFLVDYASQREEHRNTEKEQDYLHTQEFFSNGFVLCFILWLNFLTCGISLNYLFGESCILGVKVKTGLQALIFDKTQRLPIGDFSSGRLSTGYVVNTCAIDTDNIKLFLFQLPLAVTSVVKISLSFYFLYFFWAKTGLIMIGLLGLLPICAAIIVLQGRVKRLNMAHSDKRLKATSELISGMRFLKMQGWNVTFSNRVLVHRSKELKTMVNFCLLQKLGEFIFLASPQILLWIMLYYSATTMLWLPKAQVIATLSIVHLIMDEFKYFGDLGTYAVNAFIACQRIQTFLMLPDLPGVSTSLTSSLVEKTGPLRENTFASAEQPISKIKNAKTKGFLAHFENATFNWKKESDVPTLQISSLKIDQQGQLITVIGPSGAGKSSLLLALLGELPLEDGLLHLNSEAGIGYYSQEPWVPNLAFQDIIIGYHDFDEQRYEEVKEACALDQDCVDLAGGDYAEIGEKGMNLSGGQKARLCLARAVYDDKQLILLDDPLSALDSKVADHVFTKAIMRLLVAKGKTVVLVTHSLRFTARSNQVILLENGRVHAQGSWDEVIQEGNSSLVAMEEPLEKAETLTAEEKWKVNVQSIPDDSSFDTLKSTWCTQRDERLRGRITGHSLVGLAKVIPIPVLVAFFLLLLLGIAFATLADYFLAEWTSSTLVQSSNLTEQPDFSAQDSNFMMYSTLLATSVLTFLCAYGVIVLTGYLASKRLHGNMLKRVTLAQKYFFDTVSTGTILNRFSYDILTVDHKLMTPVAVTITTALSLVAAAVIQVVASPIAAVFVVPFLIASVWLINFSNPACRELVRMLNISFSPVLSYLVQTIRGISSIRAMGHTHNTLIEFLQLLDNSSNCENHYRFVVRWLQMQLTFLVAALLLLSSLLGVLAVKFGWAEAALIGLGLAYIVRSANYIRTSALYGLECTTQLNAIDRILQYCQIPLENYSQLVKGDTFSKDTPLISKPFSCTKLQENYESADVWNFENNNCALEVCFDAVTLTYHESLDPVVKNVSLKVEAGTRLGLCGRTGSGKTTLVYGLFRLVDIISGTIRLNGVDISDIPLLELRNLMTVIPQDPILFDGTVRYNLDPFNNHTDDQIWSSLKICQLKTKVVDLGHKVSEQGENYSAGERQLFCLARAFLRRSHLLVLDEVASSVDMETDAIIQRVLAQHFESSTVITIAHRVTSLLDYDVVAVMKSGRVVEQGPPRHLLSVIDGQFSALVDAAQAFPDIL